MSASTGNHSTPTVKRLKLRGDGDGTSDGTESSSILLRACLDVASKELKSIETKLQAPSHNHLVSGRIENGNEKESTRMALKINRETLDRVLANDSDNSENVSFTTDVCEARSGVHFEKLVERNEYFSGYENLTENKCERSNDSDCQAKQAEVNQSERTRTQVAGEDPLFARQSAEIKVRRVPRILRGKTGSVWLYNSKM